MGCDCSEKAADERAAEAAERLFWHPVKIRQDAASRQKTFAEDMYTEKRERDIKHLLYGNHEVR